MPFNDSTSLRPTRDPSTPLRSDRDGGERDDAVEIEWHRRGDVIDYTLRTPRPIVLLHNSQRLNVPDTITLELRQP